MKKLCIVAALLAIGISYLPAQIKKPIIMVVPSDLWCNTNGYVQEMDVNGVQVIYPDYRKALMENADLMLVISKINEQMTERDFPLKNLESALKTLEIDEAENAVTMSREGSTLAESPLDKLKRTARADIWIQVTWTVNTVGPKRSVTYNLQGLDAYTDKQIAGISGTSEMAFVSTTEVPSLLISAILMDWENFVYQLQEHFNTLQENGREIRVAIKAWDSLDYGLETEFGGMELTEIVEDWISAHTQGGRYSLTDVTENNMSFEQVMIPLYDERERALDARGWLRDLQKYLRSTYQVESKLMMSGLGYAQLVIGEK